MTMMNISLSSCHDNLPAEDTKNKVKHKEGANDNETGKVYPRPLVTYCIINLKA